MDDERARDQEFHDTLLVIQFVNVALFLISLGILLTSHR